MIYWEKEFATGIEEIDVQHMWLFDFTNSLEQELAAENRKTDVGQIMELIGNYCERHFGYEEDCMRKWECPIAQKNKCAHDQFRLSYKNYLKRYKEEGHSEALAWEIHDSLEQWLFNHICQIDVSLKAYTK